MIRLLSRWIGTSVLWLVLITIVWSLLASAGFTYAAGLVDRLPPSKLMIAWWLYFVWWRTNPDVWLWLRISGGGSAAFLILAAGVFAVGMLGRRLQLRPARRHQRWMPRPIRAASDNHGHADWLSIPELRALFPGPHPDYGGIVMGEAYRVDLAPSTRRCRFDPDDRSTWGLGGTAPLLIDPCGGGATHGMVFAGSGQYKTTSVVAPTLLHWHGSAVVLDTSGEVGPMLRPTREDMGHKVVMLDPYRPADGGFNVLAWIDTASPLAETFVGSVVEWLCGTLPPGSDANTSFFHDQGKNLVSCLLADILWDPALRPQDRTLRLLRQRVATPEDELPDVLARIHRTSCSPMARDLAGTLMGLARETFSGMYTHATKETNWLAVKAYADLVSGSSFHPAELIGGQLTVFLQLPLDTLKATPAVARVVIGALLNAVYRADGAVRGRVLFLLDEAARLGPIDIIEITRDAGRKYRITLLPIYQSEGQLTDQWGPTGKKKWFDSVSWRAYAGINDLDTAREISAICGEYGILTKSEGRNRGSSSGTHGSSSRGQNENVAEGSRALIKPDELIHDARDDEVFIIKRGARPIRCGRAIYFRRPEMVAQIAANRFYSQAAE